MAKWLTQFGRRRPRSEAQAPATVLELMVLEGGDAGQQFTVDGSEVRIGRGKPETGRTGAILLQDVSVSAHQATIRAGRGDPTLQHNPAATNPTLVNGRRIKKRKIGPGDTIQMGLIKIEVRRRQGIALSGLLRATEVTTLVDARGRLILLRGVPDLIDEAFTLGPGSTVVGRSARCDVTIPEPEISRQHLRCEWEGGELHVVHLSETNSTCVNGQPVTGRTRLHDGDELALAGRVMMRVELTSSAGAAEEDATQSLRHYMEEELERDQLIEEHFAVIGSFVDIDVVGSYKMKMEASRAAHIIVSFERFRAFVGDAIEEFGGQVLNSNGDELMCFFDSTLEAVRSASAILERLDHFNETENVLASPFRFRIGIHTGRSLVDRARGVAYSEVLDIAGHLQKAAEVNGLLVSDATLQALPAGLPFEHAGTLENEGVAMYRTTAPIP